MKSCHSMLSEISISSLRFVSRLTSALYSIVHAHTQAHNGIL
jgi:hypothetical protein